MFSMVFKMRFLEDSTCRSFGMLDILRDVISCIQVMEKLRITSYPSYLYEAGVGIGNLSLGFICTMQSAR